jgi:hypothetical protein
MRTIRRTSGCGRALRVSLRLIVAARRLRSSALPSPNGCRTRDRSSLRRDHWRTSVPHRGDAHQQQVAGATAPRSRDAGRHDAVLWPDARRGGPPPVAVAHAGAPAICRHRGSRPPTHYIDLCDRVGLDLGSRGSRGSRGSVGSPIEPLEPKLLPSTVRHEWASGADGSAREWHSRGHRFDPGLVHQTFISILNRPQVAEGQCGYGGSNKAVSVERDSVGKEQLLEPLPLVE